MAELLEAWAELPITRLSQVDSYPSLSIDPEADAAYVQFNSRRIAQTIEIGDARNLDITARGQSVGIEFLNISQGINTQDLHLPAYRIRQINRLIQISSQSDYWISDKLLS